MLNRGPEWRKREPHIHASGSVMNAGSAAQPHRTIT